VKTLSNGANIIAMSIHPLGKVLVLVDVRLRLIFWNLINGTRIQMFKMPTIAINVFWSQSGKFIATQKENKLIILKKNGARKVIIRYKIGFSSAVFLDIKDKYIILGTKDGKLIIWNIKENYIVKEIVFHNNRVKCLNVCFLNNHSIIVTADSDGIIAIWNGKKIHKVILKFYDILLITFSCSMRITSIDICPFIKENSKLNYRS